VADIHDEFDNEEDLSLSFDNEQDLGDNFDNEQPTMSAGLNKLMSQGYLFDDYYKLNPEEKVQFDTHMQDRQSKNQAGLGLGLSKGAFMPVEIANKVLPGERSGNIRDSLISKAERGIANVFGDDQTKELYDSISPEELEARNIAKDEQVQEDAPEATMAGELIGGLPANIAVGGGAGAAAQAAGLGKLATAGINIGTAGAVGEGYGIANSDAPTLSERAIEGLPSAAMAAGTAGLFEGGAALTSPKAAQFTKDLSNKLRGKAVDAAERSINPTSSQLKKLQEAGKEGVVGNKLLDEGLDNNPFMSAEEKANILSKAQNEAGSGIGESLTGLDKQAGNILEQNEGQISQSQAQKMLSQLKNEQENALPASTMEEKYIPGSKTVSASPGLNFENELQPNIISVEKINSIRTGAGPDVDKQVQALTRIIQKDPSKADMVENLLNKNHFVKDLENRLMSKMEQGGDANNVKELYSQYLSRLNEIGGDGTSMMSLKGLNTFKQDLRQGISYQGENADIVAQAKKNFTKDLNELLIDRSRKVDSFAGTNLTESLIKSNKEYGAFSTGAKAAENSAIKQQLESSSAPVLGGLGYLAKGVKGASAGLALSAGKKAINHYGNNFAATSLNKLSKLVKAAPQTFGKFAPVLQDAATRGATSLSATHFALYQNNPKYREMIDPMQELGEEQAKNGQEENQFNTGESEPEFNK